MKNQNTKGLQNGETMEEVQIEFMQRMLLIQTAQIGRAHV